MCVDRALITDTSADPGKAGLSEFISAQLWKLSAEAVAVKQHASSRSPRLVCHLLLLLRIRGIEKTCVGADTSKLENIINMGQGEGGGSNRK